MFRSSKKSSCTDFAARVLFICNNEDNNWMNADDRVAKANVVNFNIYDLSIAKTNDDWIAMINAIYCSVNFQTIFRILSWIIFETYSIASDWNVVLRVWCLTDLFNRARCVAFRVSSNDMRLSFTLIDVKWLSNMNFNDDNVWFDNFSIKVDNDCAMRLSRNTSVVVIYIASSNMFVIDICFMRLSSSMSVVDTCCVMFKLFAMYELRNDVIMCAEEKSFDRKNEFNHDCDSKKFSEIILNSFLFINVLFKSGLFDCQMHLIFSCFDFVIEFMISWSMRQ